MFTNCKIEEDSADSEEVTKIDFFKNKEHSSRYVSINVEDLFRLYFYANALYENGLAFSIAV